MIERGIGTRVKSTIGNRRLQAIEVHKKHQTQSSSLIRGFYFLTPQTPLNPTSELKPQDKGKPDKHTRTKSKSNTVTERLTIRVSSRIYPQLLAFCIPHTAYSPPRISINQVEDGPGVPRLRGIRNQQFKLCPDSRPLFMVSFKFMDSS